MWNKLLIEIGSMLKKLAVKEWMWNQKPPHKLICGTSHKLGISLPAECFFNRCYSMSTLHAYSSEPTIT